MIHTGMKLTGCICNCSPIELIFAFNKKTELGHFPPVSKQKCIADDTLDVTISFQNIQRKKKDLLNISLYTTDKIYEIDDKAVFIHSNRAIEFPINCIAIRNSPYLLLLHLILFFFLLDTYSAISSRTI